MGNWDWRRVLPWFGMLITVIILSFNMIISKLAMSKGTSFYVLSAYSHAAGAVILLPCALFLRRSQLPLLTFPVLCRICLLAVFGCLGDIASYAGINKSSPTLGSEILNLVPGFTYILAIIFRLELFNARRISDIAKSLGTVVLIIGASIVTLYSGPTILKEGFSADSSAIFLSSHQDWILGGILLSTAAFSVAAWTTFQASVLKACPSEMILVSVYLTFVAMLSTAVALVAERDLDAWKLQAEMGLTAVLYAALINILLRIFIITWCISKTGPFFVSLFSPLTVVVSVALSVIFVHESLYLGSVIGTVVLVIGFYVVVWGKGEDYKRNRENLTISSDESPVPLLQPKTEDA